LIWKPGHAQMPITSAELKRTGESLLHKFIKLTAALDGVK